MGFIDKSYLLDFEFWFEDEFLDENWGVGIHDLDGNGFLDFYANHHGNASGEIIMNFASGSPEHIYYEIPGDLHGVTFFDIDQDGDADMLQAQGGRGGSASDPDDPSLWTRVFLNDGGTLSETNSVEMFGLEYALGRKRLLAPVNFDGELGVYVGVFNDRPDGSFPGQFFLRDSSGFYNPGSPVGAPVTGEIAKGVHFGSDRFVDLINLDWEKQTLNVFENRGSGFDAGEQLSTGGRVSDFATGDFDGDLEADLLVSRIGRRESLFIQDEANDWVDRGPSSTVPYLTNTVVLAAGDFDNDGDLDYAALKGQDGVDVYTYLNRGDGTFEEGARFRDPDIEFQGQFMFSGDFNRDGALDLIVTTSAGFNDGTYVYLEGEALRNNWLSVELRGTVSETGGLGARVYVTTPDGEVQVREQDSGVHFTSQNSTDLHFGLGSNDEADVRIVWPDGYEQAIDGVEINRHVVLTEDRAPGFAQRLDGTPDGDDLRGSADDDLIDGRGGFDRLFGRGGDDTLLGGRGGDRLFGGAGDDFLSGDRGRDVMAGGSGADVFRFDRPLESRPGDRRDVVKDFATSVDVIDVSKIDADEVSSGRQSFVFIDEAAFDGEAGRLRFEDGVLQGEVDGDRRADFEIELREVAALGTEDIVL